MKWVNKKTFLAVILCFMLMSDICIAFAKKHKNLSRRHQGVENKEEKEDEQYSLADDKIFNVKNKMGQFAVGTIMAITNSREGWVKCLPQDWTMKKEKKDDKDKTNIERILEKVGIVLSRIASTVRSFIETMCDPMNSIVKPVKNMMNLIFKRDSKDDTSSYSQESSRRRRRRFFLEGKFVTRQAIESRFDLFEWLVGKETRESVTSVWNQVSEPIQKVFAQIANPMTDFVKLIAQMSNNHYIKKFVKFLDCLKSGGEFVAELFNVFFGFVTKVNRIVTSILKASVDYGLSFAALAVEFFYGLMCKFGEFTLAIKYLGDAFFKTNPYEKYNLLGKAYGQLIHATATSRR